MYLPIGCMRRKSFSSQRTRFIIADAGLCETLRNSRAHSLEVGLRSFTGSLLVDRIRNASIGTQPGSTTSIETAIGTAREISRHVQSNGGINLVVQISSCNDQRREPIGHRYFEDTIIIESVLILKCGCNDRDTYGWCASMRVQGLRRYRRLSFFLLAVFDRSIVFPDRNISVRLLFDKVRYVSSGTHATRHARATFYPAKIAIAILYGDFAPWGVMQKVYVGMCFAAGLVNCRVLVAECWGILFVAVQRRSGK